MNRNINSILNISTSSNNRSRYSLYGSSKYSRKTKNTEFFSKNNVIKSNNKENYNNLSYKDKISYFTIKTSKPSKQRYAYSNRLGNNTKTNFSHEAVSFFKGRSLNNQSKDASQKKNYVVSGNTVKVAEYQTKNLPDTFYRKSKERVKKPNTKISITRGNRPSLGVFHSTKLSPMFMFLAKIICSIVLVVAVMSIIRITLNSKTVSSGIQLSTLNQSISDSVTNHNKLQVQDSALSNTSKVRQAAETYNLITPTNQENITLEPDVLTLDENGNTSIVKTLNKFAEKQ